ncbi:MAG: YfcE family phosphodiesterase [Magnetococcales bacterium]|nr:YfcE family phosphodiesterase [Magnetococcales bacterium]
MKLGLISDSHDHIAHVEKAAEIFHQRQVEMVLHAGDMCSPPAIKPLKGLKLAGVFGNNDGETVGLLRLFEKLGGRLEGEFLELDLPEGKLALYHGTVPPLRESLMRGGLYRFVVLGHTHRGERLQHGETTILNPGTAHGFGGPATIMLFDTLTGVEELITL